MDGRTAGELLKHEPADNTRIAGSLRRLGIQPGDTVAIAGSAIDAYYVRLAEARIIAQIPDEAAIWQLSPEKFEAVQQRLAKIGVKALIAEGSPPAAGHTAWETLPGAHGTRLSFLRLPSKTGL